MKTFRSWDNGEQFFGCRILIINAIIYLIETEPLDHSFIHSSIHLFISFHSSADYFLATDSKTGDSVLIQKRQRSLEHENALASQVYEAQHVKHPNIVELYGVYSVRQHN